MIISFQQALDDTKEMKRHLLIGNGFSISLFPNKFSYGSLLEEADFSKIPEAITAFDTLKTTDFELVIQSLRQIALLLPLYLDDKKLRKKIEDQAEGLKELLIQAIATKHPENFSDISESEYQSCRKFLANFIGESRSKTYQKTDLRGSIYTLNYDLLLYWALLHKPLDFGGDDIGEEIHHDDGFRTPEDDLEAEYVTWDGEEASHGQKIHYLHGAIHLYDYGYELQKKCWQRSGMSLMEQTRNALNNNRFPLFVSEGRSEEKFEHIRHSAYLHKCLRSFRANCDIVKNTSLFIFGHSLADNDAHILKQIEKGKIGSLYVSLYGDPTTPENKIIINRGNNIKKARSYKNPLEIYFFDAATANVWKSKE